MLMYRAEHNVDHQRTRESRVLHITRRIVQAKDAAIKRLALLDWSLNLTIMSITCHRMYPGLLRNISTVVLLSTAGSQILSLSLLKTWCWNDEPVFKLSEWCVHLPTWHSSSNSGQDLTVIHVLCSTTPLHTCCDKQTPDHVWFS